MICLASPNTKVTGRCNGRWIATQAGGQLDEWTIAWMNRRAGGEIRNTRGAVGTISLPLGHGTHFCKGEPARPHRSKAMCVAGTTAQLCTQGLSWVFCKHDWCFKYTTVMKKKKKPVNMKSWEIAYLLKNSKKAITREMPWKEERPRLPC